MTKELSTKQNYTSITLGSLVFFKVIILLIASVVIIGMLRFPMTEGRAKDLDLINIYVDPVIAYMYIASIPFFVGLYQAWKLLSYVGQKKAFSHASVKALRTIQYCAIITIGFIVGAEIFLIFGGQDEDKAGPMALGMFTTVISLVIAVALGVLQKQVTNVMGVKSAKPTE